MQNVRPCVHKIHSKPFIKELLITPVVLYLNPNSITNNSYDADISEYSKKILDLENPELIMFLK